MATPRVGEHVLRGAGVTFPFFEYFWVRVLYVVVLLAFSTLLMDWLISYVLWRDMRRWKREYADHERARRLRRASDAVQGAADGEVFTAWHHAPFAPGLSDPAGGNGAGPAATDQERAE